MANQQSMELLAFNFASKSFVYRRLAQSLSLSLSAFSGLIREYFDPVIKADQCAQYVDVIGIAANILPQLIKNLQTVFQCLLKAGLRLSMAKCRFKVQEVHFLLRTKTAKKVASQNRESPKWWKNSIFHDTKKHFIATLDS